MRKSKDTNPIVTFLGTGTTIEGIVDFTGTVRLDGRVTGKISSHTGTVIIGEKAVIEADISVGVAVIMGQVKGVIAAASRIEIYPPARIEGDLHAPVISIDAGVQFNGRCAMTSLNSLSEKVVSASDDVRAELDSKVKNFPKTL